jgi:hypothetical protein
MDKRYNMRFLSPTLWTAFSYGHNKQKWRSCLFCNFCIFRYMVYLWVCPHYWILPRVFATVLAHYHYFSSITFPIGVISSPQPEAKISLVYLKRNLTRNSYSLIPLTSPISHCAKPRTMIASFIISFLVDISAIL